ncbi:MAG: SGNH/GDSL hydrolase family protein [Nitrospirae bacterium]|nr:SGNH/GDSL hydrolase family protein [Nitrospirota bacterium]
MCLINILIFVALLLSINLLTAVGRDSVSIYKGWFPSINKKANRPSLEDKNLADTIYREKKLLRTQYVPYLAWSRLPFQGKTTNVNEDGDRVTPLTTKSPVGHIRFFGGSTTWGSGVDDQNTIPAHFNALHPNYQVHNHGEAGFVSRQELARLVNLVNQNAPMDLVVFYDGCNDAHHMCRADLSINGHREESKIRKKLEPRSHVLESLTGSLRTSIRWIKTKLEDREPPSQCQADHRYAQTVAETIVNNWTIAKKVAELGGAEFHAILQPLAPIGSPNIEYLPNRKSILRSKDYLLVYSLIQEIIQRDGIDWIHDFTDAFDRDEYIYIDSCHVNALGNAIIAGKVDKIVGQSLIPQNR